MHNFVDENTCFCKTTVNLITKWFTKDKITINPEKFNTFAIRKNEKSCLQ